MVWVLVAGALFMFMQSGFDDGGDRYGASQESRDHTSAMNFMIYPLGCIAFYVYGFAIGWGNWYSAPATYSWYSPTGAGHGRHEFEMID